MNTYRIQTNGLVHRTNGRINPHLRTYVTFCNLAVNESDCELVESIKHVDYCVYCFEPA